MSTVYTFIPAIPSAFGAAASAASVPALVGTAGADTLTGSPAADVIFGSAGNDVLRGLAGKDTLCGNEGDDLLDGGADLDTAAYAGPRSSYAVMTQAHNSITVLDRAGKEGVDYLVNVERLAFCDYSLAFDLDASAGRAAMLLGAIFGPESLRNKETMGRALSAYDIARTDAEVMERAIQVRWNDAAPSDAEFVDTVYRNVHGHAPLQADFDHYVARLESGEDTLVSLGVLAQYSNVNVVHIDLVGLARNGVEYSPFVAQTQTVTVMA